MNDKTAWINIAEHGQPSMIGWWEVHYEGYYKPNDRLYWDGIYWRYSPTGFPSFFGNSDINGESYRGLEQKWINSNS